jgi:UDP-N-acetylglucosamine 2-epimerase
MSPLVATVVGARPQFIKCALLGPELARLGIEERLIHTGQHYDPGLSEVFFRELGIRPPDVNLGIGSDTPGRQTGRMLAALDEELQRRRPDLVLVFGDTNTTLAGALAAVKAGVALAHVEAGVRSGNRALPEEMNRLLTDHAADLVFCHGDAARARLESERVGGRIVVAGDVMREMVGRFLPRALERSTCPASLGLKPQEYAVLTVHRAANTEGPGPLREILRGLGRLGIPVVFPVHPRTRDRCLGGSDKSDVSDFKAVRMIAPVGYLDMLTLVRGARLIVTDSGGLQKEAFFLGTPCVTLRGETEWGETVELGVNTLVGDRPSAERLAEVAGAVAAEDILVWPSESEIDGRFGPTGAARRIAEAIACYLSEGGEDFRDQLDRG